MSTIKINDAFFEADVVDALDGTMSIYMVSDLTLAELQTLFQPGNAPVIELYNGDVQVAIYYNKVIGSLKVSEGNKVTICLYASKVSSVDFEALQSRVGILETGAENMTGRINSIGDTVGELGSIVGDITPVVETSESVIDYNIMLENLEDPLGEEEAE